MIANHPIYGHNYSYHIKGDRSPLSNTLIYLSQNDSYYIRGDRSPLTFTKHYSNNVNMTLPQI